jgi:cyclic dehypoxanthinyl futalosine synthase
MLDAIRAAVSDHRPITRDEAAWLWTNARDEYLAALASEVRARFHAPDHATYLVMAIVNTTNVCVARCDYCAFYKFPGEAGTYTLTTAQIQDRIDKLKGFGGQLVGFNGGFHPDLRVEDYCAIFQEVRRRNPDLEFYEMTVAEFMFVAKRTKLSYAAAAAAFKAAGTRWITGGGAEVMAEAFRKRHSPAKYTVADYYDAQRAILDAGIGSTATMVIGFDETLDERLEHLEGLRAFQTSVGGRLPSFLCWTYKPWNNALGGEEVPQREYLRWLALSRIYLDNIEHVRTSVLTRNEAALEGLRYGADDFDLPTEDEVTTKAGATISTDFARILASAERLGITPVKRAPFAAPA